MSESASDNENESETESESGRSNESVSESESERGPKCPTFNHCRKVTVVNGEAPYTSALGLSRNAASTARSPPLVAKLGPCSVKRTILELCCSPASPSLESGEQANSNTTCCQFRAPAPFVPSEPSAGADTGPLLPNGRQCGSCHLRGRERF